jgi:hypothetical protein
MKFIEFNKISRLNREVIVTEKIDGTNASVCIEPEAVHEFGDNVIASKDGMVMAAGSRTRFITPGNDNFGFARWVAEHADELWALGAGTHFGEWWGQGIQRRYGLEEKRFSLFNVHRWGELRPTCCCVVPEIWRGPFLDFSHGEIVAELAGGSLAAPGFNKPEGYVVFHTASGALFKYTFDKNDGHKGAQ